MNHPAPGHPAAGRPGTGRPGTGAFGPPVDPSAPVTSFGTGLLITEVRRVPGGQEYEWLRAPGPVAPAPFAPVPGTLRRVCEGIGEHHGVRFAVGEETEGPTGAGRRYRAGHDRSVIHYLLVGGPAEVPGGAAALERALRGTGALLAALHRAPIPTPTPTPTPTPAPAPGPARGLRRLWTWLAGDSRAAEAFAAHDGVLDTLRRWCAQALTADADSADGRPARPVLSHGAPGLGSLVPDPRTGTAVLLTGEDLCLAPWPYDLGWITGELAELRWAHGGDAAEWQRLLGALVEGYGRGLGERARRWAALRIALHAHDTLAYSDEGRAAAVYVLLAARLVRGGATR
ncbi:hypothetical protein [Streptomyces sp. M92]|uniref:hypothetical protein n=1 Tax=Streptomyces sp. M92 TaxID=2944250 RepID=UPI00234AA03F|nr:hypothetical protein [Streptomyces sp. M92]WCN02193.1 hypothetical protein M6G08_08990 [Streptomyces sp. M92]